MTIHSILYVLGAVVRLRGITADKFARSTLREVYDGVLDLHQDYLSVLSASTREHGAQMAYPMGGRSLGEDAVIHEPLLVATLAICQAVANELKEGGGRVFLLALRRYLLTSMDVMHGALPDWVRVPLVRNTSDLPNQDWLAQRACASLNDQWDVLSEAYSSVCE